MKRTIMICGLILALLLLFQVPRKIIKSSENAGETEHLAFAQDLQQTEATTTPGGEDLLSRNLWIDISLNTSRLSSWEYDVTIQFQNRDNQDALNAQIVFYAPNYPSTDLYTSWISGSTTLPSGVSGIPNDTPLRTYDFILPHPLPANGPVYQISFALRIEDLEECKSLSNCAVISATDFRPSQVCEDVYFCPPDLVPLLDACQIPHCIGYVHQIDAWIESRGDIDVVDPFEVQFYIDGRTHGAPINVPGLLGGERVEVSTSWTCTTPGSHTLSISVDIANVISELDETNNDTSVTCTCIDAIDCIGCDITVSKTSNVVQYVSPGDTIHYTIDITNTHVDTCNDVRVVDVLPDAVTVIGPSINSSEPPSQVTVSNSMIEWLFDYIPGIGSIELSFDAEVSSNVPPPVYITNCAIVESADDLNAFNDTACVTNAIEIDRVCNRAICPTLTVTPQRIDAGNAVSIEILPYTFLNTAALTVILPDGDSRRISFDPRDLRPNVLWTYSFIETDSCGSYTVNLSATYTIDQLVCQCDTSVVFFSECEPLFFLDRNVTDPSDARVVAEFQLARRSHVTIHIYNLAGELIVENFVDEPYSVGKHEKPWNLTNDDGDPVASGIYVFMMEEGPVNEFRKVAVIR